MRGKATRCRLRKISETSGGGTSVNLREIGVEIRWGNRVHEGSSIERVGCNRLYTAPSQNTTDPSKERVNELLRKRYKRLLNRLLARANRHKRGVAVRLFCVCGVLQLQCSASTNAENILGVSTSQTSRFRTCRRLLPCSWRAF